MTEREREQMHSEIAEHEESLRNHAESKTGGQMTIGECDICSETDHSAEAHGEALCVYQPSLHSAEEWCGIVLDEVEAFGGSVSELRKEYDSLDLDADDSGFEALDEITRDAENSLPDGFILYNSDDSWLVYRTVETGGSDNG
jgi:hypothetical protein